MSNFEEARHHGFSRADYEQEEHEKEQRCIQLGCPDCKYKDYNAVTCGIIFDDEELYKKCPYFKKEDKKDGND